MKRSLLGVLGALVLAGTAVLSPIDIAMAASAEPSVASDGYQPQARDDDDDDKRGKRGGKGDDDGCSGLVVVCLL